MSDNYSSASESGEELVYEVERILAQSTFQGRTVYLVKWLNFGDEQCTWEPAESFLTPATLADWEQQLAKHDTLDEDEVARVQARMDAFQEAQEQERLARERRLAEQSKKKRIRQEIMGRSHDPSSAPKRPRPNEPVSPKKGIALLKPHGHANPASVTSKNRTSSADKPTSRSAEAASSLSSSLPKAAAETFNMAQTQKQSAAGVGTDPANVPRELDKVGVTARPRKPSTSEVTPTASHMKDKTGQRFRNLSHQNNFQKKARREPAPDMSNLDLRSPDEWVNQRPSARQDPLRRDTGRDSPLFVPEETQTTQPSVQDDHHTLNTPGSPKGDFSTDRLPQNVTTKSHNTVAEDRPSTSVDDDRNMDAPTTQHPQSQASHDTTSLPNMSDSAPIEKHDGAVRPLLARTVSHSAPAPAAPQLPPLDIPRAVRTVSANSIPSAASEKTNIDRRSFPNSEPHKPSKFDVPARVENALHQSGPDKYSSRRSSANSPVAGDEILTAANGRTYRKGEVIVNLKFGDHLVGVVRFVALPRWTSAKIIRLKDPHERSLQLHFQQRLVMDVATFSAFSQNIDSRRQGVGAIEPYEDTQAAAESLTGYLEENNLGAIWEYPGETLLLVLYSPQALGWQHLEQVPAPNSGSRLHLAVLNKFPGVSPENTATGNSQSVLHDRNTGPASRPKADLWRPHQPSSEQASTHVQSPTALPIPVTESSTTRRDRATPVQTPNSPPGQNSMPFSDAMDWTPSTPASESRISFPANFDAMIFGPDRTQKRPRVFIAFANSHPAEAKALEQWLSQHMSSRQIYTDNEKNDWNDFQGEIRDQPGAIIFHERYPCYCDMPYLFRFLRLASLSCFRLSFGDSGEDRSDRRSGLTRLFPRGTVLCVTEDSMKNHSEGALLAMKWFEDASVGKVQFWKLVLLPDFLSWILRQIDAVEHEVQQRYFSMLEISYRLRSRSSEESSNMRRHHHEDPEKFIKDLPASEDEELVVSPEGLPEYDVPWGKADMSADAIKARDKAFVKYFIGWSAMNATKHRLFTVADANHTNKTEGQSWHIWFREPVSFKPTERK
ncbi:hypothetical protein A1O7_05224 [Cladophialophora yegresii CBS 114405]|uniref:Chromo domain-containing protein n=1 Tax=Cladophialophora yegresii CBS 114405 TaxID=1182544 RepID=W9W963_9EURO|nr:uncharacterized protein A1O7_05224 [Cladophialophora yegresii CBS 114405]EXJ61071.1 hypothetical protein A1O7_05224 [Cladophialophora yegresii CBS 114405]